jgi:Arc/MetJ-type ribon-helix-helix transcriptional regulator
MSRVTATFSVSVPPEMAGEIERVRKAEHRTRSELVREALRHYIRAASVRAVRERMAQLPEEDAAPDEAAAIREGRRRFRTARAKAPSHGVDRPRRAARAQKP